MQEYAENAYKTAGLSANEYMETVTSFSASLLQSLGGDTEAAAQYADMAITDMSDNANKMGTSMEAIQNAYNGFAKQNYTMLDNLKLGYGGTASEMQRLIMDAEALDASFTAARDENGDLAMSYADVVDAIHIVQKNMGITGTTAKEASATISGSVASMKSAWANLVAGIANENANFGQLISSFVESAVSVGENLLPRIESALSGIGELIAGLAPVIINALPTLISDVLPTLLQTAMQLLLTISTAIIDNLPMLLDTAIEIVFTLADGIIDALPKLIPAIVKIILTITEKLTEPDTIMRLVQAAFQIIGALITGISNAIPQLLQSVPTIIRNLVQTFIQLAPALITSGWELIKQLAAGIWNAATEVWSTIGDVFSGIWDRIGEWIDSAKEWGADMIQNFINGILEKLNALWETVKKVGQGIADVIGFSEPKKGPLSNFHTYAPDMMELFSKGVRENKGMLQDTVSDAFDFGGMTVESARNVKSGNGISAVSDGSSVPIVVQCVLDGQIISENTTMWQRRMARATG